MIRPISANDRKIYLQMADDFYHSNAVMHPVPYENLENAFDEMTKNNSPFINGYIFEVDNEVAGYGIALPTYSQEAGGLTVWIDEIYILPQFRGRGLGSEFIDFIKATDGVKRVRLEAEEDNAGALRLYGRMGFERLEYLQLVNERNKY